MAASKYYLGGSAASTKHPSFQPATIAATAIIGANGGPLYSNANAGCCSIENNGDTYARLHLDSGTWGVAIPTGAFLRLEFASESHYADQVYAVRTGAASGDHTLVLELTYVDTEDVNAVYIGGARPANSTEWIEIFTSTTTEYHTAAQADAALDWTTNKVDVYVNDFGTAINCDATFDLTSRVGALSYWVDVWACDGANSPNNWTPAVNGTTLTRAASALANGLIRFNAAADTNWYIRLRYFELDCNSQAAYGIAPSATAGTDDTFVILDRITAHHATTDGIRLRGIVATKSHCIGCVSHHNSSIGFNEATTNRPWSYYGCVAYSNGSHGFSIAGPTQLVGCLAYLNTGDGFSFGSLSDDSCAFGCISDHNTSDGFSTASGTDGMKFIGCVASNNAAYGYNLVDDAIGYFAMNHSYNNTSGNLLNNAAVTDGNFPAWGGGGNVVGDPKFVDRANGNFSLQYNSPLLPTGSANSFLNNMAIGLVCHVPDYPVVAKVLDDQTDYADAFTVAGVGLAGTYHAPDAAEVISTAVFGPASGTAGTFDEAARNTDPGVANVLASAGTYKIQNVTKTPTLVPDYPDAANVLNTDTVNGAAGTFDEAARNTDPGVEHVLLGEIYKILNVAKTGVLEVGGGVPKDPIAFLRRVRE